MNRNSNRLLTLLSVFAVAACGEDTLVPGVLDEAEAADLASALLSEAFQNTATVPTQPGLADDGPQMAAFEFSGSVDDVVACQLGGEVGLSGTFIVAGDTDTDEASVSWDLNQVHDACVVLTEAGREFTLWGNPDLDSGMFVEVASGVVEWSGAIEGSIDWENDGREGTCVIGLEFSGRAEGDSSIAATMSGAVCGVSVERAFSIG